MPAAYETQLSRWVTSEVGSGWGDGVGDAGCWFGCDAAGVAQGAVTNSKGVASVTVTAPAAAVDPYVVTVSYAGDSRYAESTSTADLTVAQADTQLVHTGATRARPGQRITSSATLTSSGTPAAGRTITFTLDGATQEAVTDSKGVARVSTTAPRTKDSHDVTVTFDGDDSYRASETTGQLDVS
jgi:hypothetical protein